MTRMVLLHLPDDQVDILTKIQEDTPASKVVVVHPDENALIRRLARLSDLESFEQPPQADPGDVVVALPGVEESVLAGWRELGVAAVAPDALRSASAPNSLHSPAAPDTQYSATAPDSQRSTAAPVKNSTEITESPKQDEPRHSRSTPRLNRVPDLRSEPSTNGGGFSLDVLASPESTFAYVVQSVLGEPGALWWDGGLDVWTPWIGAAADGTPPQGHRVETDFGRFVIAGPGAESARWNDEVVERVLTDLALRDLAEWTKQTGSESSLRLPQSSPEEWFEAVIGLVQPVSAMLWVKDGDRWGLSSVHGEGIAFSGTYRVSQEIFEGQKTAWEACVPDPDICGCFRFPEGAQRWPLQLRRLEKLSQGAQTA